jgi:hypothetical protein
MKSLFARKAARGHWPHEVRRQRMGGVHLRTNPSSRSVVGVCIAALGIGCKRATFLDMGYDGVAFWQSQTATERTTSAVVLLGRWGRCEGFILLPPCSAPS